MKNLLTETKAESLLGFIQRLEATGLSHAAAGHIARISIDLLSAISTRDPAGWAAQVPETLELEQRWYESLKAGTPDYGIYSEPAYVADVFACWRIYSRGYLRAMWSEKSLAPLGVFGSMVGVQRIVDIGCGIGYTTSTLAQIFPGAQVFGVDLDSSLQGKIAASLSAEAGWTFRPNIQQVRAEVNGADLVFASEYFEHIQRPIEHLHEVLEAFQPRYFIAANAFGAKWTGHFNSYQYGALTLNARATAKQFALALKDAGYERVKTKLWNGRPSFWRRERS